MKKSEKLPIVYERAFIIALIALPLIGIIAPRFLGFGPPLIAAIGYIAYRVTHDAWPKISARALFWGAAFPALMCLSALWSIAPFVSLDRAMRTFPVTISGAVLLSLGLSLDKARAQEFLKFFPYVIFISGVICALEVFTQGPIYHMFHNIPHPEKRFNGAPLNRGTIVFTLCALPAIFCVMRSAEKRQRKIIYIITLSVVTALALIGSTSQSAQLGFILAILFFFLFPVKKPWTWTGLAICLAALLCVTPWLAEFMFARFAAMAQHYAWLRESYAADRMEIWNFVSQKALQRPLLGFGAEATKEINFGDIKKVYWPYSDVLHPHNFAVQLWIEFGALGALAGSLFFADLLRMMRKIDARVASLALATFMACLSIAATGYGLWQSWWMGIFCVLLAYIAILINATPHNKR